MLRAAFLDVGQGDTTVVWNPDTEHAIVVDCVNAVAVWKLLEQEQVKHISAIIITHLHADHYKQLTAFLDGCQVRGIEWDVVYFHWIGNKNFATLSEDFDGHSKEEDITESLHSKKKRDLYLNLASWANRQFRGRVKASFEWLETIEIPGIHIEFLHPFDKDIGVLQNSGKLNNTSAVFKISDGGASLLLTGDLEPDGWKLLTSQNPSATLTSNVLKFPHHGGWKDADVVSFLSQVAPQIVVISVGTSGYTYYKHPNAHVFEALKCYSRVQVLCTQATSQCDPDVLNKWEEIKTLLGTTNSRFNGLALPRGCPCASTIIVELTEKARVCYPLPEIHQQIVNCLTSAQCRRTLDSIE